MLRRTARSVALVALAAALVACGDDGNPAATRELDGRALFLAGTRPACADCHVLSDAGSTSEVGPPLDDSLAPDWFIAQVIRDGVGIMPAFEGQLSDDEIDELARYVESVSG
jgi:cytochrome c6